MVVYNLGFGSNIFLTEAEWETYRRRPPVRYTNKSREGNCEVCGLPGEEENKLTNAHVIGFYVGVLDLGLTPEFLDRHDNLVTAHRRTCNGKAETTLEGAMHRLIENGVTELPDYLPPDIQFLWQEVKRAATPSPAPSPLSRSESSVLPKSHLGGDGDSLLSGEKVHSGALEVARMPVQESLNGSGLWADRRLRILEALAKLQGQADRRTVYRSVADAPEFNTQGPREPEQKAPEYYFDKALLKLLDWKLVETTPDRVRLTERGRKVLAGES